MLRKFFNFGFKSLPYYFSLKKFSEATGSNRRLSIDEAVKILETKLSHISHVVNLKRIIFKNMELF